MKYYKVVNALSSEITIDTSVVNYNLTLTNTARYKPFLDLVTDFSALYDTPLDFVYSINNNLSIHGNLYLQNLPKATNRRFELYSLTHKEEHQNFYISEDVLIELVESLDFIGINLFDEGNYLWETIFEKVRVNKFQSKVSRGKSFFLFDNLEDCQNYIQNHKGGGVIANVEIISGAVPFKGDMNLLDSMSNHLTLKKAENIAEKYWAGSRSASPVYEYLFQGVCKMSPR
ncbi:hypothetical protein [Pedobacter cryoconitis]|uniref:hypothetical protein n=1 Tax=Pedobacter cryoconitis TaxID=188932 RepID=UPI00160957C3|nr:hypothetical protein [Pedobacter cryoconitis]MBB5643984.1 hypothetical protein [Pedobacter cryoconitis]